MTSEEYTYPAELIRRCWQALCLCQFHDTLPGTMAAIAVRDTDGKFAEIQKVGKTLLDEALSVLFRQPKTPSGGMQSLVINTLLGLKRIEVIRVEKGDKQAPDAPNGIQMTSDGKGHFVQAVIERGSLRGGLSIKAVQGLRGESAGLTRLTE